MTTPPPLAVVVVLVATTAPPLAVPVLVVVLAPLPVDVLDAEVNWRVGVALHASTVARPVDVKMNKGK
jgi:hypothetical protein